jgi:hypothetical protein
VVTLSGGRPITDWQPTETDGVWRADVGDLDTRQLYVDGDRAPRAWRPGGAIGELTRTATGYTSTSTEPLTWTRPDDIELVYGEAFGYAEVRCGIASIEAGPTGSTITMDDPCLRWSDEVAAYLSEEAGEPRTIGLPTRIESSLSFLGEPGAWYLDRSTAGQHVLFYRSRAGENPPQQQIIAPRLETLVSGRGTTAEPLRNVSLRGLTFAYATWQTPSTPLGFVHVFGSGFYAPDDPSAEDGIVQMPGNVRFELAEGIEIERNRFVHLGAQALTLSGGEHRVEGNVVEDVSGGGFELGADASGAADVVVANNWIRRVGAEYGGAIGIAVGELVDATIEHNQINEVPYSGIVVYPGGRRIQVLANHVYDTNNEVLDGGGIYVNDVQGTSFDTGTLVQGNLVHDVRHPDQTDPEVGAPNAIYIDWYADFVTVERNVVYDNLNSIGGVFPRHVRIDDNFLDDGELIWYRDETPDLVTVGDNTILTGDPVQVCAARPACAAIVANVGLEPEFDALLDVD